MKIDRVEIRHVAMPLLRPWRTAYGEDPVIEGVLVRLSSNGLAAWGESSPLAAPTYSPEWAGGLLDVLERWLAPAIVGQEIGSGAELQEQLGHFKGNRFAKAALDTAWWSLEGTRTGRPLHELIGGRRDRVQVGADFEVMDSLDELMTAVGAAVDSGFRRVKLKFRPGWDLEMVAAVRSSFADLTIHVDCNSGYTLADLDLFRELDRFGLAMIEQPLAHDDLADHAKLQAAIETPVCLDESIVSARHAEQAAELGSCRYVNVKPGRVGGLTEAIAVHDVCRDAGIPCWVGGMLESGVGSAICVALATLENFTYPADIFPSERFYREDLAAPHVRFESDETLGPCAVASSVPGIEQAPKLELLEALTIRTAVLEAR